MAENLQSFIKSPQYFSKLIMLPSFPTADPLMELMGCLILTVTLLEDRLKVVWPFYPRRMPVAGYIFLVSLTGA